MPSLRRRWVPFLFVFTISLLHGTEAPDWLKQAMASASQPRRTRASSVRLLDFCSIKFLPGDRAQKIIRHATLSRADTGLAEISTQLGYDANGDHVISMQAWIVSADGKKITSYGKNDFIDVSAHFNQYFWDAWRVLSFSRAQAAGAGTILAWEYVVEVRESLGSSDWEFRSGSPVLESVFEATPAPGGRLVYHATSPQVPNPTPSTEVGGLRWEMHDLTGLPSDMPDGFKPAPVRIAVRCASPNGLSERLKTWTDFAAVGAEIIGPRIVASPALVEQANALVKGKSGRWDRIRALAEFVQKQIAYFALTLDKDSFAGYRPHLPDDVVRSHFGDCKDKATLLAAMLRAIGEDGHIVLLNASDHQAVVPDWPSGYFNHAIIGIPTHGDAPPTWPRIDGGPLGELVLFDPTHPGVPLGVLPVQDQGGYGLVLSSRTPGLVNLPAESPDENHSACRISAQLAENGDLAIAGEETFKGTSAANLHYFQANQGTEKFRERLEARWHACFPLTQNLTWSYTWDAPASEEKIVYKLTAEHGARLAGPDLILLSPRLFGREVALLNWKKSLDGAVWLPAQGATEEVLLEIPAAFSAAEIPSAWRQETEFATASLSYRIDGNKLIFTRELRQKSGLIKLPEYTALRSFYQQLDEAERRPFFSTASRVDYGAPSDPRGAL